MHFEFSFLPGSPIDIPRPTVEVAIDGPTERIDLLALVDTGALYNRFGVFVADYLGIDLDDQVQCDAVLLDDLVVLVHATGRNDLTILRAPHPDEPLMFGLG